MTVVQLSLACGVLGVHTGGTREVMAARIIARLAALDKHRASTLALVFPDSPYAQTLSYPLECHQRPGEVLTLKDGQISLAPVDGSASQQWRLSAGLTGSLVCDANRTGRLAVASSGPSDSGDHQVIYTKDPEDASSGWVYDKLTCTYCLRCEWIVHQGPNAPRYRLALAVSPEFGGTIVTRQFAQYATNAQMWSCAALGSSNESVEPVPIPRTYTPLFGNSTTGPLPTRAPAMEFVQVQRASSDSQDVSRLVKLNRANQGAVRKCFDKLDADGNGVLDERDWQVGAPLVPLQPQIRPLQCSLRPLVIRPRRAKRNAEWIRIREYMDLDGNGQVDFDEFRLGIIREAVERNASDTKETDPVGSTTLSQQLKQLSTQVNTRVSSILSALWNHAQKLNQPKLDGVLERTQLL